MPNKKNKISFFYKINFFIALFISLILLYFIILVSAEPKSFPYITKKIETYLKENFSQDVVMERSYISFTPYGSFKISVTNLQINKSSSNNDQEFEIPLIEGEFPLYNVFLLRFAPRKIKIIDPTIIFHPSDNVASAPEPSDTQNPLIYSAPLINFLSAIKNDKLGVKTFEMQNLKFVIRKENKSDTEILLKKSNIKIESKNRNSEEALQISLVNIISFNNSADINLSANCKFNAEDTTLCSLALTNLTTSSIANLNPALNILDKINTTVNSTATLTIKDQQISTLTFKAQAKSGYFDLPEFFSKKINFSNLTLSGEYDNMIDALNLSAIEADLNSSPNPIPVSADKAALNEKHLSMSLSVANLQNVQNNKLNFLIKLQNVPTQEIEAFWPISLPGQDIRQWVVAHLDGGKIDNAFAKFSLITANGVTDLDTINSQISFTDLNLNYDEYFPKIMGLKGVAGFTKDKMNIAIASGNVLSSKIYDANITIDDFNSEITMLNIVGNLTGKAADGLKHTNYKSAFSEEIEKYFNGSANGNFNISIPLLDTVELKDLYIAAVQNVENLNSEYMKGGFTVTTTKNFNSTNFVTSIDLTAAEITSKVFDIEKKLASTGGLDLSIIVGENDLQLKNINLWKREEIVENKNTSTSVAKLSGNISINLEPFALTSASLKNQNFGKNDYTFSYQNDEKKKSQKILISGKVLNLASFLQNKLPFATTNNSPSGQMTLRASINKVWLVNKKSLNQLNLSLNSTDGIFYNSAVKAGYSKQQSIDINTLARKPKENFTTIAGTITDVGYLAEGLNISDTISGGTAKIKLTNQITKNLPIIAGEIKIDNDITFYENNATKRLAKNTLFSTVKDTIFSNNKTIFDSVKLDFTLSQQNLEINSLLANNYKIGITAKGFVNLANNTYDIKGMIIPGFVINSLFGIGKIPLIGGVISGVLTGGEGGGLFGIKYQYKKLPNQKEATFETDKVSAFVPVSIRNLFDGL